MLDFALRVGTGVGGPVQGQVGRHPWRIAFGREQPYGAAAFNSSIRGVPQLHFVVSRTINSDPEPQASRQYIARGHPGGLGFVLAKRTRMGKHTREQPSLFGYATGLSLRPEVQPSRGWILWIFLAVGVLAACSLVLGLLYVLVTLDADGLLVALRHLVGLAPAGY